MDDSFDGYRKWLGIPPEEQPPHHYRLLGIAVFEDDPDVIENAANRQMTHVRTFQSGRYSKLSQKLLNELSTAKICLLNTARKTAYDQELKSKPNSVGTAAAPPPKAPPLKAPPPRAPAPPAASNAPPPQSAPPLGSTLGSPLPIGSAVATVTPVAAPVQPVVSAAATSSVGQRARSRKKSSPWPLLLGIVSIAALLGLVVVITNQKPQGSEQDPNGLSVVEQPVNGAQNSSSSPSIGQNPTVVEDGTPPTFAPPSRVLPNDNEEFLAAPRKKPLAKNRPVSPQQTERFREVVESAIEDARKRDLEGARRGLAKIRENLLEDAQREYLGHALQAIFRLEDINTAVRTGVAQMNRLREAEQFDTFEFRDTKIKLLWFERNRLAYLFGERKIETTLQELPTEHALAFASLVLEADAPNSQAKVATFLLVDHLSTVKDKKTAQNWMEQLAAEGHADEELRWVAKQFAAELVEPAPTSQPATTEGIREPAVQAEDDPSDPFGVGKPGDNPFKLEEDEPKAVPQPAEEENPFF